MQRNFAVGAGAKPMAALFEFTPLALEIIKLTVNDNVDPPVFTGDWLIPGGQINDAQPGMAQAYACVTGNPGPMAIGPSVMQASGGRLERVSGDGFVL